MEVLLMAGTTWAIGMWFALRNRMMRRHSGGTGVAKPVPEWPAWVLILGLCAQLAYFSATSGN